MNQDRVDGSEATGTTVRRRQRGRPRDEGADGRILASAAALMLARGVDDVTVDEVAEQAGVGKATVYRRYPSKEAMAAAALRTLFSTSVPVPDTGSFRRDMEETYRSAIRFATSPEGRSFMRLAAGAAARNPRVADLYRSAYEDRRARFRVIVERARRRGELDGQVDPDALLDSLPSLLLLRTVARMPLPTEADAERLLDLHLRGSLDHSPASDPLP